MSNKFTYRQSSINELEQLHELAIISYNEFKDMLESHHFADMDNRIRNKEQFSELVAKAALFVCEHDGCIVGAAYLMPKGNPIFVFQPEWSVIRMVGVHPSYRGYGISKELTKQCIAFAKQTGEQTIALHTSEFMNAARHIYESLGFMQIREIEPLFGKRYWLYLLDLKQ
jgi:ribosomal protein S18 acetylase RimI-like enzyme